MDKLLAVLTLIGWLCILAYLPTACDKDYQFQQERLEQFHQAAK